MWEHSDQKRVAMNGALCMYHPVTVTSNLLCSIMIPITAQQWAPHNFKLYIVSDSYGCLATKVYDNILSNGLLSR
jgi:hypothetical protein